MNTSDEYARIWMEMTVVYCTALSQYLPGSTESSRAAGN